MTPIGPSKPATRLISSGITITTARVSQAGHVERVQEDVDGQGSGRLPL